jgi:hypothetical protein
MACTMRWVRPRLGSSLALFACLVVVPGLAPAVILGHGDARRGPGVFFPVTGPADNVVLSADPVR